MSRPDSSLVFHPRALTEERIRNALARDAEMRERRQRGGRQAEAAFESMVPGMLAAAMTGTPAAFREKVAQATDHALGDGAGDWLMDWTRLMEVCAVLEKGTVQDAIARVDWNIERQRRMGYTPPPALVAADRAREIAKLREISRREEAAVLQCLDALEQHSPGMAARIRQRHDPEARERMRRAAAAHRNPDPARTQLTAARIREILPVLEAMKPWPGPLRKWIMEPRRTPPDGPPAAEVGARAVKALARAGHDPAAFLRDLWWLGRVYGLSTRGSLDDQLAILLAEADPRESRRYGASFQKMEARIAVAAEYHAEWIGELSAEIIAVGHAEEAAVRALAAEIGHVLYDREPQPPPPGSVPLED
jgi:sorbitol-specific phosphotransferase system component IIA